MGTYFPMSNNPRDAATMLYPRDRLPNSHSETPVFPANTMTYNMNYSSSSMDLHPVASESSSSQQEVLLNFGGGVDQNQWKDNRNEIIMMHGENPGVVHTGGPNSQGQGLSLSLSTNVPPALQMSSIQYENNNFSSVLGHNALMPGENLNEDGFQTKQTRDSDYVLSSVPSSSNDVAQYGMPSIARGVASSKYLKAAQQLLDEVVSVKKDIVKDRNAKKELLKDPKETEGELGNGEGSEPSVAPKADGNSTRELSVAEKQELQNKVTKLLSMLNEVDRRYRQYYHQMQIVVSSFDVIAGSGASKPYTALALQTISRHFRCLRDAITAQILAVRKSLGEDDASLNDKGVGISRLRYVDQQLRQQRALQQLGIMQQHAWRPQRGLPETSVSILRAWLFEHFLHPYPKDSEKIMLARQTGLSRSQVSNWFINARVRLWKPMVEEMYKEETGDADMDSNSSSETAPRADEKSNPKDKGDDSQQATASTGQLMESRSDQMTDMDIMGSDSISIFQNVMRAETQSHYGMGKTGEGQSGLYANAVVGNPNCGGGDRFISAYHISEFGNVVSPVSLTLGLQRCEGDSLSMAGDSTTNHGFNPLRDGVGYNGAASAMANGTAEFDCLDSGNRTHQFVSSLLPSFT